MEIESLYNIFLESKGVTTDSRKCADGLMFFALKGECFNGNSFAAQALSQGCICSVVDDARFFDANDKRMVLVDNVLKTLQQLALYHRRALGLPVIGITGTNGKTTTKELVTSVMRRRFKLNATVGNLNNSIGVPLTVLATTPADEYAIVEMGASHPGDIRELVDIAEPDYGLITNVGKAHLLGFGSFEGVMATKGELYDFLRAHGGKAFVNRSNPYLMQMAQGLDRMEYASGVDGNVQGALVSGKVLECNPYLKFQWQSQNGPVHEVQTRLIGSYNIDNALAAASVGVFFGVPESDICQALEEYTPSNNRSQLTVTASNRLVVDAYNANPTSMAAALENFSLMQSASKMLILGDMRELGDASDAEHQKVVEALKQYGFENVWLVGAEFQKASAGAFRCFDSVDQVIEELSANPVKDRTVLLKGSNGIGLFKLVEKL